MDKYTIREEFLQATKGVYHKMFDHNPESVANLMCFDPDMEQLGTYQSVHENIVYLTAKGLLFGHTDMLYHTFRCIEEASRIIAEYNLDVDLLDPLTMGGYFHGLGLQCNSKKERGDACANLQKSLSYFNQTEFDERKVFLCYLLGISFYVRGDLEDAIISLRQGLSILQQSTDITDRKRQNLLLRIKSLMLIAQVRQHPEEDWTEQITTLTNQYLDTSADMHYYNDHFKDLVELNLGINAIEQAKHLTEKQLEVLEVLNKDREKYTFPSVKIFDDVPATYYLLSNVIKLHVDNPKLREEGFDNLNRQLDHYSTDKWYKSFILRYQLQYLIKLYRGFSDKSYYTLFLEKADQLMENALTLDSHTDLLIGIMLKAEMLKLVESDDAVIDYLKEIQAQLTDLEVYDVVAYLEDEIDRIAHKQISIVSGRETVGRIRNHRHLRDYIRAATSILSNLE